MLDDNSLMPWGKHKGEKMANIPAQYLLWCYKNDKCCNEVKQYVENNMDELKSELI